MRRFAFAFAFALAPFFGAAVGQIAAKGFTPWKLQIATELHNATR